MKQVRVKICTVVCEWCGKIQDRQYKTRRPRFCPTECHSNYQKALRALRESTEVKLHPKVSEVDKVIHKKAYPLIEAIEMDLMATINPNDSTEVMAARWIVKCLKYNIGETEKGEMGDREREPNKRVWRGLGLGIFGESPSTI